MKKYTDFLFELKKLQPKKKPIIFDNKVPSLILKKNPIELTIVDYILFKTMDEIREEYNIDDTDIKNLNTAAKLAIEVFGPPQDYNNLNLPKSQEVVGRLISFGIRCTWTEEQMIELTTNISACVNKAQQSVIF